MKPKYYSQLTPMGQVWYRAYTPTTCYLRRHDSLSWTDVDNALTIQQAENLGYIPCSAGEATNWGKVKLPKN